MQTQSLFVGFNVFFIGNWEIASTWLKGFKIETNVCQQKMMEMLFWLGVSGLLPWCVWMFQEENCSFSLFVLKEQSDSRGSAYAYQRISWREWNSWVERGAGGQDGGNLRWTPQLSLALAGDDGSGTEARKTAGPVLPVSLLDLWWSQTHSPFRSNVLSPFFHLHQHYSTLNHCQ